jgi:hypothetical protein
MKLFFKKSDLKNIDLKRNRTKFDIRRKKKQIIRDEIEKQFQLRKR